MGKLIDLTGKRFGKLTVVNRAGSDNSNRPTWLCKCDCGNEKVIRGHALREGFTVSCGCYHHEVIHSDEFKEVHIKHGLVNTSEYRIWSGMIKRCTNEKSPAYPNYGGRGIEVCERWLNFKNFYADMGKKPSNKHTLERVDNDKGYNPENCVWATRTQQSRNTRTMKRNTTGVRGVSFNKSKNKYQAYIHMSKKMIHLGFFNTLNEATEARQKAEEKYWKSSK